MEVPLVLKLKEYMLVKGVQFYEITLLNEANRTSNSCIARYSEILKLKKKLKKKKTGLPATPFPPKMVNRLSSEDDMAHRRLQLESWLQALHNMYQTQVNDFITKQGIKHKDHYFTTANLFTFDHRRNGSMTEHSHRRGSLTEVTRQHENASITRRSSAPSLVIERPGPSGPRPRASSSLRTSNINIRSNSSSPNTSTQSSPSTRPSTPELHAVMAQKMLNTANTMPAYSKPPFSSLPEEPTMTFA